MVEMEMTMDKLLAELGYIPQMTPAGRVIMVNPAEYPLSEEFLADDDAYMAQLDENMGMDQYD